MISSLLSLLFQPYVALFALPIILIVPIIIAGSAITVLALQGQWLVGAVKGVGLDDCARDGLAHRLRSATFLYGGVVLAVHALNHAPDNNMQLLEPYNSATVVGIGYLFVRKHAPTRTIAAMRVLAGILVSYLVWVSGYDEAPLVAASVAALAALTAMSSQLANGARALSPALLCVSLAGTVGSYLWLGTQFEAVDKPIHQVDCGEGAPESAVRPRPGYGPRPPEDGEATVTFRMRLPWGTSSAIFHVEHPDGTREDYDASDGVLTLTGPRGARFILHGAVSEGETFHASRAKCAR